MCDDIYYVKGKIEGINYCIGLIKKKKDLSKEQLIKLLEAHNQTNDDHLVAIGGYEDYLPNNKN